MNFGKFEIPPIRKEQKEEVPVLSAEQQKAEAESIAISKKLLEYQDEWSKKALDAGITISTQALLDFNRSRGKAMNLAEKYSQVETVEERDQIMSELQNEISALEGPLTSGLEAAIEEQANQKELTAKEKKENFVVAVEKFKSFAPESPRYKIESAERSVSAEKEAMAVAEEAYLTEYKNFYTKKGSKEKNEPQELKDLKQAYDESRIAYGNKLTEGARTRLEGSGLKPGFGEKKKMNEKDVLERYNRLVRYNEIIKPAAEKRYNARVEAMGVREKGLLSKGLTWVGVQNAKLENKFGKNGARFVRAAATTLVVGGVAAAAGAFGTAGLLGALGWGTFKIGRSLASSFVGAGAGEFVAQAYGASIGKGKLEKASKELAYVGRSGRELTLEELGEFDASRMTLEKRSDERTLEKEKMIVRVLTAMGVGAGMSGILSQLPSGSSGIGELASGHGSSPETPSAASTPDHAVSNASVQTPSSAETPVSAATSSPEVSSVPVSVSASTESLTVGGSINNADRLLGHFREQLHSQYPDPSKAPASVQALFKAGANQDDLSKALGFQNAQSMSAVMHEGDTVTFEHNALVFHTAGDTGAGHTLIDAQGKINPVDFKSMHHPITSSPVEEVAKPTVSPETTSVEVSTHEATVPESITPVTHGPTLEEIETMALGKHDQEPLSAPVADHIDTITTPPPAVSLHESIPHTDTSHVINPENTTPKIESTLTPNNFDLSKNAVGVDAKGNLFAHVVRTDNINANNDTAYSTATEYSIKHPGKIVYFVEESKTGLFNPTISKTVSALRFDPETGKYPLIVTSDSPTVLHEMPPIPNDSDLKPAE